MKREGLGPGGGAEHGRAYDIFLKWSAAAQRENDYGHTLGGKKKLSKSEVRFNYLTNYIERTSFLLVSRQSEGDGCPVLR